MGTQCQLYPHSVAYLHTAKELSDIHELDLGVCEDSLAYAHQHIAYVWEAGLRLNVSTDQLYIHDASKFSKQEFKAYALYFHGTSIQRVLEEEMFAYAWLHHIHNNEHHWLHWIFPGDTKNVSFIKNQCISMPSIFINEMVADWLSARRQRIGRYDVKTLDDNYLQQIQIHPVSNKILHYWTDFAKEEFSNE